MEPTFGMRLTSWLKFVGMSQATLARALDVSKAAVNGWTQTAVPGVDRLEPIVKALGIPGGVAEFYARMPMEEAKDPLPDEDEEVGPHPATGEITRELDAAAIDRALAGHKGEAA